MEVGDGTIGLGLWPAIVDWDDAYENSAYIPDGASHITRWQRLSQQAGAGFRRHEGVFMPENTPLGLMVFIHGGYWMETDPGYYAHLAKGALSRGWAVLLPSYPQAPEGRLGDMVTHLAARIEAAAAMVEGPVVLSGHSAGGHLAARLCCADTPFSAALRGRIARLVTISGLFDLRPLQRTAMAGPLGLTTPVAIAESPALQEPLAGLDVHAWVGADERPEFKRQSALLALVWHGLGVPVRLTYEKDRHHFDVIDGLSCPDHPLTEALLGGIPTSAA